MVSPVKPGTRLANSTILIMHLVASSLNLSHRPRSSLTRWSALEFCNTHTNPNREEGVRWRGSYFCHCTAAANDLLSAPCSFCSIQYVSHLYIVSRLHKTWALKKTGKIFVMNMLGWLWPTIMSTAVSVESFGNDGMQKQSCDRKQGAVWSQICN